MMAASAAGSTVRNTIRLHYDIVSPYSYLAFVVLLRYKKRWDYDLVLQPMYLGSIMMASGNKPPGSNPHKAVHNTRELALLKQTHGVELTVPDNFPPQTLYAIRLLRTIQENEPDRLLGATTAFFSAMFADGVTTWTDPSALAGLLTRYSIVPDQRAAELLKMSQSDKCKEACKSEPTALVESANAFGFPWIQVTKGSSGETINVWGSDRFELIAWFLGKEWAGPNPGQDKAKL